MNAVKTIFFGMMKWLLPEMIVFIVPTRRSSARYPLASHTPLGTACGSPCASSVTALAPCLGAWILLRRRKILHKSSFRGLSGSMFGAVWLAAALAVSRGERCSRAVTRTHPASYSDPTCRC